MADDTKQKGPPDPSRINVNQPHEVRYWTEELGVSADELRAAVAAAGVLVQDVRRYLNR